MPGEVFVPVLGYENLYSVSNYGRVYSIKRHKCLKPCEHWRGYLRVGLIKEGQLSFKRIHRLVAEAFLPNPQNKPQVNHINEDKHDNRLSNLEWCTCQENITKYWENRREREHEHNNDF